MSGSWPKENLFHMSYLIIVVVLLLVLAPIISILPSKRQKLQMVYRQEARSSGISVALVKIEDPDSDRDKYLSATGRPLPRELSCVAYRKPRKRQNDGKGTRGPGWVMVRDKSTEGKLGWDLAASENIEPEFRREVEARVGLLPQDVVRIDEVADLVSVYWQERTDELGLEALLQFLKDVVELSPCLQTNSPSDDGSVNS